MFQHTAAQSNGVSSIPSLQVWATFPAPPASCPDFYPLHTNCRFRHEKLDRLSFAPVTCLAGRTKPCTALYRGQRFVYGFQVSKGIAFDHNVNHSNDSLVIAAAHLVSTEPLAQPSSARAKTGNKMANSTVTQTVTQTVTVTASSLYAEKKAYAELITIWLDSLLLLTKTMVLGALAFAVYIHRDTIPAFIVALCHGRGTVRQNLDSDSETDDSN